MGGPAMVCDEQSLSLIGVYGDKISLRELEIVGDRCTVGKKVLILHI